MPVDDPFGGGERTIIRPNPGGKLGPAATPQAPAASATPAAAQGAPPAPSPFNEAATPTAILDVGPGLGPLADAAAPILALVARMARTIQQSDVEELRRRVRGELAAFEKRSASAGLKPEIFRACHYALCATVDDVAADTPWGSQNVWANASMARIFHNDTSGGERFFHLLRHFESDPGTYGEVLELFYLCVSLGFQGRFRILPEGAADHASIRERLYLLVRKRRGEVIAELSPHWRGIAAPHRPLTSVIPLWVMAMGVLVLLLLVFIGFRLLLELNSDTLFADLGKLPEVTKPRLMPGPPPPPPPPPPMSRRVTAFLEPEIKEGLITVDENGQSVRVRLRGTALFVSGSDQLQAKFLPTIDRIATALKTEPGNLTVLGHTDNQPIRTVRFPSNYELSLARANAVRDRMLQTLPAERIKTEGRGDSDPIADNKVPEGREQNRRIEFVLVRSGGPS